MGFIAHTGPRPWRAWVVNLTGSRDTEVPLEVSSDGVFFGSVPLADSVNWLKVIAKDSAGNRVEARVHVYADHHPPTFSFLDRTPIVVYGPTAEIQAIASESVHIDSACKNGRPTSMLYDPASTEETLKLEISDLPLGPTKCSFVVTDDHGNVSEATLDIVRKARLLKLTKVTKNLPDVSIGQPIAPLVVRVDEIAPDSGKVVKPAAGALVTFKGGGLDGTVITGADGLASSEKLGTLTGHAATQEIRVHVSEP